MPDLRRVLPAILSAALLMAGAFTLLWQVFTFLKTGTWIPISVAAACEYLGGGDANASAVAPTDWQGLHSVGRGFCRLLEDIALSADLIIGGSVVAVASRTSE
jgi:hypothetical protein